MAIRALTQSICSNCKQVIELYVRNTDLYICPQCIQVYTKQNLDLQFSAKYIRRPDTMSSIQIGTEGSMDGRAFRVIGCLVLVFEDKFIHLWRIVDADGVSDWLIQFPNYVLDAGFTEANQAYFKDLEMKIGMSGHQIPGLNISYTLSCITKYKYTYALGEVNMIMKENDKGLLYQFHSHKGNQFLLFVNTIDSMTALAARNIEFSELALTRTKTLGLWSI